MKILIINPNSSVKMTEDIQDVAVKFAEGRFEVITLPTIGAPEFIDTFEDVALATPGMIDMVRKYEKEVDAFIVACHCDPNLDLLRELVSKPVIGIGEASMKMATMLGHSFSIVTTGDHSIPEKRELIRKYRLENYFASIRVPEDKNADEEVKYMQAARAAIEEDLAEVIVLGCAGLCELAKKMTKVLGVPVLDGVVCALILAEGMVNAGISTSKIRYYSGLK